MRLGHYTSTVGLIGIFESKELWATNIKYLNDEKEFDAALDLVQTILASKVQFTNDGNFGEFQQFVVYVTNAIEKMAHDYHQGVFTFSFSAKTDL